MGTLTKELPKKEEPKQDVEKPTRKKDKNVKQMKKEQKNDKKSETNAAIKENESAKSEEEDKLFNEIVKKLEDGDNVDYAQVVKKIDDEQLRAKVLMRVKLHLDPHGSREGKRMKFSADGEGEEEANFNEMMDGLGKKCLGKMAESLLISGLIMLALYLTGSLENVVGEYQSYLHKAGFRT